MSTAHLPWPTKEPQFKTGDSVLVGARLGKIVGVTGDPMYPFKVVFDGAPKVERPIFSSCEVPSRDNPMVPEPPKKRWTGGYIKGAV
jgi:hypothetical protein